MKGLVAVALSVTLMAASPAAATRITIDVRDADIGDVISLLAAESGRNIVTDESVRPERITLRLKDVTFDQALDVLTSAHNLQIHYDGSVILIGLSETMNRRYPDSPSSGAETVALSLLRANADDAAKEIAEALPPGTVIVPDRRTSTLVVTGAVETIARARELVAALDAPIAGSSNGASTRSYHLQFLKADDAVKQLKQLSSEGVFLADGDHNQVIVEGSDSIQSLAGSLFRTLDRPSPQVMFEVKVADVTPQNDSSNFGIEFGGTSLQGTSVTGSTAYAFAGTSVAVNVTLNALMSQGRAEILATPKLVTVNNREADLLIGETYPVVFNSSVFGGQNVQFVDVGVKLRLTPTIGDDGTVTAELHPEYSEIEGTTSAGYPIIANRRIDSTLRVNDSQTIVLGGLMRDVSSETLTKFPGLADIPIIGKLFQNKETSHERDEIVFLITPHVIFPDAKAQQK